MRRYEFALAFLVGAGMVFGFAPYHLWGMPILTLAYLFHLWHKANPLDAAVAGLAFGLGLFIGGVGWVFVPLYVYGGMPWPFSALTTFLFCFVLALFPALAGWIASRIGDRSIPQLVLFSPAVWTLVEWGRGFFLTGFPWLTTGYVHVPDSPFMGYAPIFGVYGLTFLTASIAGCFAALIATLGSNWSLKRFALMVVPLALALAGWGLSWIQWSSAMGAPISVSLLQGNIPEEIKFDTAHFIQTLDTYADLIETSSARLTVLPESAIPIVIDDIPKNFLGLLEAHARNNGGDVLLGAFTVDANQVFHNSVVSLGSSPRQLYQKVHLVPFGEFIPFKPLIGWVFDRWLHIPLDDQGRGSIDQGPLHVAGQQIAVDVCYEDVFGEEIIRALPAANLLVNVTNDAWYGRSLAPLQHYQMAQMRAAETARWVLRATNTGITGIIDEKGRSRVSLPEFVKARLDGQVTGRVGLTPYVYWGNAPAVVLALLGLSVRFWRRRTKRGSVRLTTP